MHDRAVRVLVEGLVDLGLLVGSVDGLIEQGAYRHMYMHRTGHWLGLDVHDVGSYRSPPPLVLTFNTCILRNTSFKIQLGQGCLTYWYN